MEAIEQSPINYIGAKELRMGNYVWNPTLKENRKVDYLDIRDLAECRLWNPFEPIKLTDDWFLNFGFRRIQKDWSKGGLIIHTRKRGYSLRKSVPDIKSVHQLQNLFFALTGKELILRD